MKKSEFYANARNDLDGPLHGVTVVEATTTWAGPMAGCVLADFGARVIKVEHPAGEVIRRLPPIIPDSNLTVDIFAELGLPAVRVNTYAEVIQEEHLSSRDMMLPTKLADGKTVPIVGPAAKFSRTPTTTRKPAPALGENNAEVLGALGVDLAELMRLKAEGVV